MAAACTAEIGLNRLHPELHILLGSPYTESHRLAVEEKSEVRFKFGPWPLNLGPYKESVNLGVEPSVPGTTGVMCMDAGAVGGRRTGFL